MNSKTSKRLRTVSRWAYLVLERAPRSAAPEARRLIRRITRAIVSFDECIETEMCARRASGRSFHVSEVEAQVSNVCMKRLARDVAWLCVYYVIQAPPGLHGRLLQRSRRYRAAAPYMSVLGRGA